MRVADHPAGGRRLSGLIALVLALGVSVTTCRLDKLINPASANRLTVNRDSVVASAHIRSLDPVTTSVRVSSADGVTLPWMATETAAWMTLVPSPDSLVVMLQPDTVLQTLRDTIVFSSLLSRDTLRVPVVFTMLPPAPVLSLSDTARVATAFLRSAQPDTFRLRIKNPGGLPLDWTATLDTGWVTLSDSAGTVPAQDTTSTSILVTLRPESLGTGTHRGAIAFAATGALPDTVRITYTIDPCEEIPISTLDAVVTGSIALSDCGAPQRSGRQAKLYAVPANAGDTLSFRLAAAFDEYLVLTNSTGVAVLDSTGVCGVDPATACIRDIVIPTTGTYVVEVTTANAGETGAFTLSAVRERAPSAPAAGQFRADSTTAIVVGAVTTQSTVVFKATLNDPNSQDSVRLQLEVTNPASGTLIDSSAFVPRGTTAAVAMSGLTDNDSYHWRARTCDKTARCSAWFNFGGNVDPAADFRVNSVPQPPGAPSSPDQFNGTGQTQIPPGGGTGGGLGSAQTITFRAVVTDPDPGDMIALEVEVQDIANAFGGGGTLGVAVSSGSMASVSVVRNAPLIGQNNYYWRVRACDQVSQCGAWVSFGGTSGDSPPRATDFHVP